MELDSGGKAFAVHFRNGTSEAFEIREYAFDDLSEDDIEFEVTDSDGNLVKACSSIDFVGGNDLVSVAPGTTRAFEVPVAAVTLSFCLQPGRQYRVRSSVTMHGEEGGSLVASDWVAFTPTDPRLESMPQGRPPLLPIAHGDSQLELRILTGDAAYRLRVAGPIEVRELSIRCEEGCGHTYREGFPDYPISVIRPGDALEGFCVLATTGSAMALHCYALGDTITKSAHQGLRSVVSVTRESVVVIDGEGKEVAIPWSRIEGEAVHGN